MRHRKTRRFRYRSHDRSYQPRDNGDDQVRLRSTSLLNGRARNNFRTPQSAEKLVEKYNTLAKEALSSGDEILSENYFQHADHFTRIVDGKSLNQNQHKVQISGEPKVSDKHSVKNSEINQDQRSEEKK